MAGKGSKHQAGSVRSFYQAVLLLITALRDLFILWSPTFIARMLIQKGDFAFLIHPRDLSDVARKYPIFSHLPPEWVESFTRYLWPIVGSRITGLQSSKTGESKTGYI